MGTVSTTTATSTSSCGSRASQQPACRSATCVSTSPTGASAPTLPREQVELLAAQERRLALEVEHVALRRRYVQIKIDYWHAVEAGDTERADLLSAEARSLADELKRVKAH